MQRRHQYSRAVYVAGACRSPMKCDPYFDVSVTFLAPVRTAATGSTGVRRSRAPRPAVRVMQLPTACRISPLPSSLASFCPLFPAQARSVLAEDPNEMPAPAVTGGNVSGGSERKFRRADVSRHSRRAIQRRSRELPAVHGHGGRKATSIGAMVAVPSKAAWSTRSIRTVRS
jgi:hypothetical protein